MVKVRYTYNNKIVAKDVYETALIVCDMKSKSVEPLELLKLKHLYKTQFPGSTSTCIVNHQPPVISEAPPNNNNQNVAAVAGGAPVRIRPLAGGARVRIRPLAGEAQDRIRPLAGGARVRIRPLAGGAGVRIRPLAGEAQDRILPLVGGARDRIQAVADGARDRLPPVAVIENVIGECSRAFVKQLTKSDLTDGLGRLALHKEFVNSNLVPMFNGNEDLVEGIDVITFDSEGRQYDMTFKLWTSKLYVLTKSWKEFYKTNNLTRSGEYVTVWMFRHVVNHRLCFVIIQGRVE